MQFSNMTTFYYYLALVSEKYTPRSINCIYLKLYKPIIMRHILLDNIFHTV